MRIKKGDTVTVRSGSYKGKQGTVLATHPTLNKLTVEGINIAKKHVKKSRSNPQGGIVEVTKPIWVSKVSLVEPGSKRLSRIGYKVNKDGSKVRVYKQNGKEIDS
ncbi:MAG TPA: 50S ribosomal protein L24 [Candidatus Saccharimonadales bacterium]|nr:50S ribosomal protein L24 [Candidatus Saccharimonadales bacterium]